MGRCCRSGPATANVLCPARTSAAALATDVRIVRRFILAKLQGSAAMPSLHHWLRHPSLRLEHVAVQDRCDTRLPDIVELRDVESAGHAHQYASPLAAKTP